MLYQSQRYIDISQTNVHMLIKGQLFSTLYSSYEHTLRYIFTVPVCLGTFVEEGGSGLSVVVPDTELKVEMVGESCTEVEEEMIDKVTDEVIDEVIDGVMDEVSDEDATSDDTELDKVMNDDEVADETDAELEETSDDSNTELVVIDVDGKILTVEETTGGTGFAVGVFSKSKLFTQQKSLISGHSSRS
jgi:hypothetical protein